MNYHAAIKAKYPNAEFELRDDGDGVYFYSWNDKAKMPDINEFHEDADEFGKLHRQALEAKEYLASTDWMLLRQHETDKAINKDISKKRNDARLTISNARSEGILI